MNPYEAKQEARRERLEDRAERLRAEAHAKIERARDMAEVIPFGQPILVGHYSEKRDRNYREKIHNTFAKGYEALQAAETVAGRAASVGTGGISSDDPEAVAKLREELAEHEAKQELWKAINLAHTRFLKDPATLETAPLSDKAKETVRNYKPAYSWEPHPIAPFQFSNIGANIRRIRARIESLEKAATRETKETLHPSGVRLVENADANRVQLFFAGKPAAEVRADLKARGFRWSPTEGAWQRHLNNSGVWAAKCVLNRLTPGDSAP